MGWSQNIFQLLIVVSGPPFTGLFVYSPGPGAGNLIASVTAAAGTDPYGNHYDQGITSYDNTFGGVTNILGAVIKLFAGVTQRAILSPNHFTVFNASGATIYDVDLSKAAQFLYADTGSATQGALVASQSQNSGTDQFGNAYDAGVVNYSTTVAAVVQMLGGTFNFGSPAQIALTGSKQPGSVGLEALTEGTAQISTGLNGATDAAALFLLWSKNAGGGGQPFAQLQTAIELSSNTPPTQRGDTIVFDDANAFPVFLPGTVTGDTTTYKIGHRDFWSTTDQQLTSTAFATVCGSAAVGAGAYRVRAVLQVLQGATSAKNDFRLGFTGTISQVRMKASFTGSGGVANSTFVQTTTTNNGLLQAPAFAALAQYVAEFEGIIITTSSGTLSIQAAEDTAGDPFTVQALSVFELSPAN